MCMIEKTGYSEENKNLYCSDCIILNAIGKCEYLQDCEAR
jgi:hypothetical protein